MDIQKTAITALEKRLDTLKSKVPQCFPLVKGCVTVIGGSNKLPRYTSKKDGKSYSIYLGEKKAMLTRKYIDNYKKLNSIIDEMSEINLELIKRMEVARAKKSAKNF